MSNTPRHWLRITLALVLASALSVPLTFAGHSSAIHPSLLFPSTQNGEVSKDGIWSFIDEKVLPNDAIQGRVLPRLFRTSHLNEPVLARLLAQAPKEFARTADVAPEVIALPMPDGRFASFIIMDSPIMEPALAVRFPEIRTYRGQGLDDPTVTTRFDWTPSGFHAIILSSHGTMVIEPFDAERGDYLTYYQHDLSKGSAFFNCLTADADRAPPDSPNQQLQRARQTNTSVLPNGSTLRTYRVAIGVTGEYAQI